MRGLPKCVCGLWFALLTATSALATPLHLHGALVQGGIVRGQVSPGSRVWLDEAALPVAAGGDFVIGFDRDAAPSAQLQVQTADGRRSLHPLAIARREYDIQHVNGVPEATVNPPEAVLARIRDEAAQVRAARAGESELLYFAQDFVWPLSGRISGVFGSQRVYNGSPRSPHYGVDIAAPVGTPVRAPAGGLVLLVHPDMFYSGGTLIIDHGHGLSSTFIHLHRILVKPGQRVAQGDLIAEVGKTGRATGPHLDWRMNWRDRRVDPVTLVGPMPSAATTGTRDNAAGQETAYAAGLPGHQGAGGIR